MDQKMSYERPVEMRKESILGGSVRRGREGKAKNSSQFSMG